MTVLTTVVSRPVNGRAAAAVEQLKQLQQTALDSGAERAAASRVITGPNVGTLQLRIFTESLTHAGEVSSKCGDQMFTETRLMTIVHPPS